MMIFGKIIGAALGYAIGGIVPALIGLAVGHLFDRGYARVQAEASPQRRQEVEKSFFETLFTLLGYLAKADGRVSEHEVRQTETYMSQMGLTAEHRREAINLFKQGSGADFDPEAQIARFRKTCGRRPNLVRMLLVYLVNIALADGKLDDAEAQALRRVAAALGISAAMFEQLLQMIRAQNSFGGEGSGQAGPSRADALQRAYEALGIEPEATDAQVKRAYRKLMSQHHPDKLIGQGMPDDMVKEANVRSHEIRTAYDLINRARAGG